MAAFFETSILLALKSIQSPIMRIYLFHPFRTHTISDIVGQVKRGSSAWLKTTGPLYSQFHWQNRFGAFSVSQSGVGEVREYIRSQAEHHKRVSFQDEFRGFLKRYEVDFDERVVLGLSFPRPFRPQIAGFQDPGFRPRTALAPSCSTLG